MYDYIYIYIYILSLYYIIIDIISFCINIDINIDILTHNRSGTGERDPDLITSRAAKATLGWYGTSE